MVREKLALLEFELDVRFSHPFVEFFVEFEMHQFVIYVVPVRIMSAVESDVVDPGNKPSQVLTVSFHCLQVPKGHLETMGETLHAC